MLIVVWIITACAIVNTACNVAGTVLRLSDEYRFRHALDGIERQEDSGQIVIPKRQHKTGHSITRAGYRQRKAAEFINNRIK